MTDTRPNDPPLDPDDLDRLWDFSDPAGSEARFREAIAASPPGTIATAELATQLARSLGLQHRFDDAHAVLDGIRHTHPRVRARVELERGRLRNSAGNREAAVPHFVAARSHAAVAGDAFLEADALHMLAIADEPEASAWVTEALALLDRINDRRAQRWRGPLHNNLGWTLHDRGDHEAALAEFQRALRAFLDTGTPEQVHVAHWTIGRCLRSLGRLDAARAIQQRLAAEDPPDPAVAEELAALEQQSIPPPG